MVTIPEDVKAKLLENGGRAKIEKNFDPEPVLKLFAPWDRRVWLVSEMSPDNHDVLFGLADLGVGEPELGTIFLSELSLIVGIGGLTIELDRFFRTQSHSQRRCGGRGMIRALEGLNAGTRHPAQQVSPTLRGTSAADVAHRDSHHQPRP